MPLTINTSFEKHHPVWQHIWYEIDVSRPLLQTKNKLTGMHIHNLLRSAFVCICLSTRGTVIGDLINICAEPPQQEETERHAFNTNAYRLQTKNKSGMEPTYMLHVNISGGLGRR